MHISADSLWSSRGRVVALVLVAAWLASLTTSAHAGVFKRIVFESGTEGYNIYRIPTIVKAANGDLLAFAEARSGGDASEIDIVMINALAVRLADIAVVVKLKKLVVPVLVAVTRQMN